MSKKKQNTDKTKQKSKKNNQQQRIKQENQKQEQQKLQAKQRLKVLETSGILDAYQYFLRSVCKNGLPDANIFEFAAQKILKYEKKLKQNNAKKQQIDNYNKSMIQNGKQKNRQKLVQKKQSLQKIKSPKVDSKQQILKSGNKQRNNSISPQKRK